MQLNTKMEVRAYFEGRIVGITDYAWWKDGIQYIGTGSKTRQEAVHELTTRRNEALQAILAGKPVFIVES